MANKQSPTEALHVLGQIATDAISRSAIASVTGACVYTTSSGTHCAVLTKAYCDQLNGNWTEGGACPSP
jgi:hypothetical protein